MKKRWIVFLWAWMLVASVPAFADWAPQSVQDSLKAMYPTARDVAWSRDGSYFVADFMMDGFDTKVWFDGKGQWRMKQTDWVTMDEVPAAVYNAFVQGYFSGGFVQDVTYVEFPVWQAIIAVELGQPNIQTKYQLLFSPDGKKVGGRNITYVYNPLGASFFL